MAEIMKLNKKDIFKIEGVEYVALIDLECEGYEEETDSYSYKIYATKKGEENEEKYYEIKFLEPAKKYNGKTVEFTEKDIYLIEELVPSEGEENA